MAHSFTYHKATEIRITLDWLPRLPDWFVKEFRPIIERLEQEDHDYGKMLERFHQTEQQPGSFIEDAVTDEAKKRPNWRMDAAFGKGAMD